MIFINSRMCKRAAEMRGGSDAMIAVKEKVVDGIFRALDSTHL